MFSVVIPLYNKERSIKNTINSVLNQYFKEFEIVLVNDGSTDNSLAIVQEIKNEKIRIINQENQGVSAARNRGIKEAKYDWIAFLDGDDLWKENHLELMNRFIRKYPSEKVFATSFEESNGRKMNGGLASSTILKLKQNDYFSRYLSFKNLLCTITIVADKSFLLQLKGFNPQIAIGEDLDLWARISKVTSIIKSGEITAIYRLNAENRSDEGTYNMEKSFLKFLNFKGMSSKEERFFYRYWIIHNLKNFIVQKDYKNIWFLVRKYGRWILFK